MYQIGTSLVLWNAYENLEEEVRAISIRGYRTDDDLVRLPADLWNILNVKNSPIRLSVPTIASGYCPIYRDVYLEKKERIAIRGSSKTWGNIAGKLIDEYMIGMHSYYAKTKFNPKTLDYPQIRRLARGYSEFFWESRAKETAKLEEIANNHWEHPSQFKKILGIATEFELSMLASDARLARPRFPRIVSSKKQLRISYDSDDVEITPHLNLGLSEKNTPDFLILNDSVIVGEIKSGATIDKKYLITVAGYALAYESAHNADVDFGLVYFVGTHLQALSFPSVYFFVIDDSLRKLFLDSRNTQYSLLSKEMPLPIQSGTESYQKYCTHCKFLKQCHPNE